MRRMTRRYFLRFAQVVEVVVGVGFGVIFGLALMHVPGLLGDRFVIVEIGLMMSSGAMVAICAYLFWKTTQALRPIDPE